MSSTSPRLPRYAYVSTETAARHAKETEDGLYDLLPGEVFWRDRFFFLDGRGYTLRPRYRPDWKPSWIGTNRDPDFCEDSISLIIPNVIDATRRSDGFRVSIKSTKNNTAELKIAKYLTDQQSTRNYCAPVLEIMQDPAQPHLALIFMPCLQPFYEPEFGTIGEVTEFIRQSLEGLVFMHECRVAHRDIAAANVMMDGRLLYPEDHHPVRTDHLPDGANEAWPFPRSKDNVRYYYIDFGLSRLFEDGESTLVLGCTGRDKQIPELSNDVPYDAYRADVFALGNLYYKEFLSKFHGLDLIRPLVDMMKWKDPGQRPTAEDAFHIFESIYSHTDETLLRWRLRSRTESAPERVVYDAFAVAREGIYQLRKLIS